MVLPFSVFLREGRPNYYVAFKNEETGSYLPAISTKQPVKDEAIRQAWIWYRNGIPRKNGPLDLKTRSLRDTIRHAPLSMADAEFIIGDLRRRGLVASCVFAGSPAAVRLADFLDEFWDWDKSPYIQERLRQEHSIHRCYVRIMRGAARKYWAAFFPEKLIGELLPQDIDRFVDHLAGLPLSNVRKNSIIKSGTIALRWAFRKEKITREVTQGLIFFSGKTKERRILTLEQAAAVFNTEWADKRSKIANMLAMVTGLRGGEIQGLRVRDLGDECLLVRHSWNPKDRLKTTKNNEERIVELPFPLVLQSLKYIASLTPHGFGPDSYVFWAARSANKPMEQIQFVSGLRSALAATGVEENTAREFTFHAWRHFFTSYMRNKVEDKLLQSQTGHKTLSMLERYSNHRRSGDRNKIREAQVDVFASLLPDFLFSAPLGSMPNG
jgi:integrase